MTNGGASRSSPLRRTGGGWREFVLVFAGATLLTAAMTYPLARHPASLGRTDGADGQFSIWNVAWVARTLVVDPLHVGDANIFYPRRSTLFYSEANLGAGVLAMPAYWITRSPYVANNIVTLLAFILSALGAYYLVRYLAHDRRAAVVSAILFSCCPYVFAHLPHIQLLMTAGLPLSMLAFHRLVDRPSSGRAVVLGLTMSAQALFCGYYAIFVMLMVGFGVLVVASTRRQWLDAAYWRTVALAAVVAILAVVPLFLPYLRLQASAGFGRDLGAGRLFSADLSSYLASSAYAHAWMLSWLDHWREVAFPGFVATLGGIASAGWLLRDRRSRESVFIYGGLAALAFWASFGPDAKLYTAMYYTVPGFTLLRGASRFCLIVAFGLSVLTGLGLADLLRRVGRPAAVGAFAIALAIGDLFVSIPFQPVPTLEPAYRLLATLPPGPVLEMPVYSRPFAFQRARYMLASTAHWMPLVDAYSDYIPEDFTSTLDTLGDFPGRDAFRLLAPDRVRYAVFHVDQYGPEAMARLQMQLVDAAPYLRRQYADEHIWLYEIVRYPSE